MAPSWLVTDAGTAAALRACAGTAPALTIGRYVRPSEHTLAEAGRLLGAHPSHLVRAFSHAYGIAPHRYVTGRRVDLARCLLLAGMPPAEVAAAVGFHDQSHLTRHFRRILGSTPAAFAA